jgi:hypothetical protein
MWINMEIKSLSLFLPMALELMFLNIVIYETLSVRKSLIKRNKYCT